MSSFTDMIHKMLAESPFGSKEQKQDTMSAARVLDTAPGETGTQLKSVFVSWVAGKRYLAHPIKAAHNLPPTSARSDADVAREYGLASPKMVENKQEQLAAAREVRINRAIDHLDAGWTPDEIVSFLCGQDEYETVMRRAGIE